MKSHVICSIFLVLLYISASSQSLEIVGSCLTPYKAWTVYVEGNYAYVACDSSGLQIVDISDPSDPVIVAFYNTPGISFDIFVTGQYAYIADFSSLQIINISDPLNPSLASDFPTSNLQGIQVNGDIAYLACGYHSPVVYIVDVSDPNSPDSISGISFLGGAFDLYYSNAYISVLSNETEPYDNYLRLVNVVDPQNPFVSASLGIPGVSVIPFDVKVIGAYAYIADRYYGLQIANILDPNNPFLVGSYDTPGDSWGVFVKNGYAIIADYSSIQVVDIHDPENPNFIADGLISGSAVGVYATDEYIFVTDYNSLVIFRNISLCDYIVGDINDSGNYDGLDIIYGVNYFKGGDLPPYECECTEGSIWYVAGDVNGNCQYNGLDITFGVNYFKGGAEPIPCPDCPPPME